jgi:hypothetical protein
MAGILIFSGACGDAGMTGDEQLTVSFQEKEIHLYENSGINRIEVELSASAPYDRTITVVVRTEENIREGKDYLLKTREIRIAKGEKSGELELELLDDKEVNADRSLVLSVLSSSSVSADPAKGECLIRLLDDESNSSVEFAAGVLSARENDGTVFIPFLLQGTSNGEVIVSVGVKPLAGGEAAVEATHFVIVEKEIVFNPETDDPSAFGASIALTDDTVVNPDRSFIIEITRVYNAVRITERSTCIVTIVDNELSLTWGFVSVEAEEDPKGGNTLRLPIRLQRGVALEDLAIALEFVGEDAGEIAFVAETEVVLPVGEDSVVVAVTPVYDPAITGDRKVQIRIKSVEGYPGSEGSTGDITVYDYDTDVTAIPAYYAGSNLSSIDVSILLSNPVRHNVEIALSGVSGGGESLEFPASVMIPAGETALKVPVNIYPGYAGLDFTLSASPVSGVTQAHLPLAGSVYVRTGEQLDRSAWSINSFSSEASSGEGATGRAKDILDGNAGTYWHSKWSGGYAPLPHEIVVDMQERANVTGIKLQRRLSNNNTKAILFSVSDDLQTWIPSGSIAFTNVASENIKEWENTTQYNLVGRYLKLYMPDSHATTSGVTSIAEVYVNGFLLP